MSPLYILVQYNLCGLCEALVWPLLSVCLLMRPATYSRHLTSSPTKRSDFIDQNIILVA
jgi:hypothetical protein